MMKRRLSLWIMLGLDLLMVLVNLLARLWHAGADWYIAHIFPYISAFWSRISGIFPFSVGEWLIVTGIVLIAAAVIGFPLILIFGKSKRRRIAGITAQVYGWILTWVFSVMTMRFFVLYQGSQLSRTLGDTTYDNAQVLEVCRILADELTADSPLVERDADGYMLVSCDVMQEAKDCMARLSEDYPQYRGFYPDAKPIYHAYFFTQQNLLGIYYAHTMEANYNPVVYEVNLPVTICHEYTHLKGNIFEDEAGYYAFLACMTSEEPAFRYAACISAFEWMEVDFGEDADAWLAYDEIMMSLPDDVWTDMYAYVPESYLEEHKETDEVIPTAIVSDTADAVMDASLKVNGVTDGKHSYQGMTALLLHYFLDES